MKRLNIGSGDLSRLTVSQKVIAHRLAMSWNPLGHPEVFRSLQENILRFFLGLDHQLDEREEKIAAETLAQELIVNPPEVVVEVPNGD